jgi:aspartate/methionine/tyrosine aminotransferase
MSRALARLAEPRSAPGTLAFVSAAREMEAHGIRVARLDIGEPHFATPPHIVEAALAAMRDGHTKYVTPQGLPELRAEIAAHARARGIDCSMERIVVGSGVKPLLLYSLLALVGAGDEVLVPDPGYPGYEAAVRFTGASVRKYPLTAAESGWAIDVRALRDAITPATRVLVLNSPHNPTGAVTDDRTLHRLAEVAERHDLWILSDEIYGPLTYDKPVPPSIAALAGFSARTLVLDGFSKAYAMTGWRLGYAILPATLVAPVTAILGDAATCTPAFVQRAGIAALTGPQEMVADMRMQYRQRRDELVSSLRAMPGVQLSVPSGALYAFADVSGAMTRARLTSSAEAAHELLTHHAVACVPGSVFGGRGEGHVRLSFAMARDDIGTAIRQLGQWVRTA